MNRDVALYLKIRWRMVVNSFLKGGEAQIIASILGILVGFLVAMAVASGLASLAMLVDEGAGFTKLAPFFDLIFLVSFALSIVSSIVLAFASFFSDADLPMWLTAPTSVRSIFFGRYCAVFTPSAVIYSVFALPGLFLLGSMREVYAFYLALIIPVSLLLLSIPASAGTLLVFGIVKLVSPKRIKEAFAALSALFGSLLAFSNLFFARYMADDHPGGPPTSFGGFHIPFLPSGWASDILVSASTGNPTGVLLPGALLSAVSFGLLVIASFVVERSYLLVFSRTYGVVPKKRRAHREGSKSLVSASRGPISAIVKKDLLMIFRDAEEWMNFIAPIALAGFIVFSGGGMRFAPDGAGPPVLPFVVTLTMMISSRLSLTGIARERRGVWALHQSPLPRRQIVVAKTIVAFVPATMVSIDVFFISAGTTGLSELYLILGVLVVPGVTFGLSALASIFGALSPNFEGANAKELMKGAHGLLNAILSLIYLAVLFGVSALPQLGRLVGFNTTILWLASLTVFYAMVAVTSLAFLAIASKRLERLEVAV